VRPAPVTQIETPEILERHVLGIKSGRTQSLVILGRGGTGKSRLVREGVGWRHGHVSPV
jgi:hypothetical protein